MLDMHILLNLGFSIDMMFFWDFSFCYFTFGLFVFGWIIFFGRCGGLKRAVGGGPKNYCLLDLKTTVCLVMLDTN